MSSHPPGLIGLPCSDSLRTSDIIPSILAMQKPPGTKFKKSAGLGPAHPLNEIAGAFLAMPELEWLFLTNDDNLCPPDTIPRLLDRNVDVVSGLYFGRIQPFEPILFDSIIVTEYGNTFHRRLMQDGDQGMVKAQAVGDGCLLIRRHVMERIPPLWWEYGVTLPDACDHDVMFSQKVVNHGFSLWCDLDVKVDHMCTQMVRPHRRPDGVWEVHLVQGSEGRVMSVPAPKG